MMKKGLALEGGAMRGMFTCGVIDIFMENGIEFDGIAGISAGALYGANYKSKQIGRGIRYNKKYGRDPRYFGIKSLLTTGDLYGKEFCYHDIVFVLDPVDEETYNNNPIDFFIGTTDCETGETHFYNSKRIDEETIEWMRASASMPLVSTIVEVGGYKMLDGGITCPIPYKILEDNGYDKNVIVLTQPRNFTKEKTNTLPLIKIFLRKYPKIAEAMGRRHIVYNKQLEEIREKEKEGKVFVISPYESLNIKRTENNPEELERVYQIGRKVMNEKMSELKQFLQIS